MPKEDAPGVDMVKIGEVWTYHFSIWLSTILVYLHFGGVTPYLSASQVFVSSLLCPIDLVQCHPAMVTASLC